MPNSNRSFQDYDVPDVVYIDVDGTLIIDDRVNRPLVKWARNQATQGKEIIVWSARGEENARNAVDLCGLNDIVSHTLSKPGYVVDDLGSQFTHYMNIIDVNEINNKSQKGKQRTASVSLL